MASIPVSSSDLTRIKTTLAAMKRGKWELEGEEVLAFAQAFAWLASTHDAIKISLETPAAVPSVTAKRPKAK